MISICKDDSCTGCGLCASVCSTSCIEMTENEEGFRYPLINNNKCINCNRCVKLCPSNNEFNKNEGNFYMGWHKDDKVLLKSSSGGAITALSQIVFEKNGVVFGAFMNPTTHNIQHIGICADNELDKIRLSKYYQGSANEVFPKVKELLLKDIFVMFTGVACQIAGLYSYLGRLKDSPNLLTVDVLCHGVSNKKVVEAYLSGKEKQLKKKLEEYRFRVKPDDSIWDMGGGTRMRLNFTDGTKIIDDKITGTYFVGFNSYLFLRKSCYECKYVGTKRISDITLADFWGVKSEKITKHEREMGVSVITLNTCKAQSLLDKLSNIMQIIPIDKEEVTPYNQAFVKPSTINPNREYFFKNIDKISFDKLVHKCEKTFYRKYVIKTIGIKILGETHYKKLKEAIFRK